jgi:ABC-type nitrate/sulfonate/bicarbonate transport system permease component
LRPGVGGAVIGMVVADFFTEIAGLGALIVKYGNPYDTTSMFVPILTVMLLGVTLTALIPAIESSIAPWKELQGD